MALLTIKKNVQKEIVIEKSRFICTLKKAGDEETAAQAIRELKKQYWDATHNCSAYIIGENMEYQRSSDDGEPSGTAGAPMLEVLKKRGLHNVLAVVTRYFGGIKLGAGGLVRAYTNSVASAIEEAGLAEKALMAECVFYEDVAGAGRTLNLLYQQKLFTVGEVIYGKWAAINIVLRKEDMGKAEELLTELLSRPAELSVQKEVYAEIALL